MKEDADNFKVLVQREDFDVSSELALLRQDNNQVGAITSFVGLVRDINDSLGVSSLQLEHYPGMTERSIERIVLQASERWALLGATVIHRIGRLSPADQIVLVAVSSLHRGESFAACEFIMDYLKTQAPFWKKELTSSGERWVDARSSDDCAARRWES
jgi:molybdopterin synthase catalytic subunit